MPLYTFFPTQADGSSLAFQAEFLPSDGAAVLHAAAVRLDHTTCCAVEVWEGGRHVGLVLATARDAQRSVSAA